MSYVDNTIIEGLIYGVTLGVKTCILAFTFVRVRASFPRIRYLMYFQVTVTWGRFVSVSVAEYIKEDGSG